MPSHHRLAVHRSEFGKLSGRTVMQTTLSNSAGMQVDVIDYGAIIRRVLLPPLAEAAAVDVVLGFDDLDGYLSCSAFFGAIVGRVANRIGGACFTLDGTSYPLAANDPPHHLHGGSQGFDKVLWTSSAGVTETDAWVRLLYVAQDGEEGYPGEVRAGVLYSLSEAGELRVEMTATSSALTPVALAHHSYWNLAGHDAGTLAEHTLTVFADEYTPGAPIVPNGTCSPVEGTVFDLREPTLLCDLSRYPGSPPGYDHNFVVRGAEAELRPVAELLHTISGRRLKLVSNQPGVQVYTGNFLDGGLHGKGASYPQHSAICLETQAFPNAINVPAWRHQVLLQPGAPYQHTMIHTFI